MEAAKGPTANAGPKGVYLLSGSMHVWIDHKRREGEGGESNKKPTRFLTNGGELAKELRKRCDRSHGHQQLVGGRAAAAARCPEKLCRAFCAGLMEELNRKKQSVKQIFSSKAVSRIEERGEEHEEEGSQDAAAWDDLTGEELSTAAVQEARKKEIGYITEKKVWKKMWKASAWMESNGNKMD